MNQFFSRIVEKFKPGSEWLFPYRGTVTNPQIARILEKLDQACAQGCESFGARQHQFRLNACLRPHELAAFEEQYQVELPEEFRMFLLQASDGGAGPYYGISKLSNWQEWFEDHPLGADFLSTPCPLIYEHTVRPDWAATLPPDWKNWGVGSIHLCDQGCTYCARLIITGKSRGRIVYLDSDSGVESRPYFAKDANFLDWYERWLDMLLSGAKVFWYGMDNPDYPDA